MIPLMRHLTAKPEKNALLQLEHQLQGCIDKNGAADLTATSQLQLYLFYLDRVLGKAATQAKYQEFRQHTPDLPGPDRLLPPGYQ